MTTQDLNTLDTKAAAEQGIVVELEHPFTPTVPFVDDDGQPYYIKILGGDAGKVREKSRKQLDRYIALIRKNRDPGDAETGEQDNVDRLASATLEWHLPPLDGAPVPAASEASARKLYSDPRFPWIVEQLTKAINDRARFFVKSSSS
jgi:hypothetical protein